MNALQEKKDEINKSMGDQRTEGAQMKNDLMKMKKAVGYNSEQAIDERIATIEHTMHTGPLTLKEEKQYMLELSELKKNRPKVAKVNKMEGDLNAFRAGDSGKEMKATIQEINAAMAKHR